MFNFLYSERYISYLYNRLYKSAYSAILYYNLYYKYDRCVTSVLRQQSEPFQKLPTIEARTNYPKPTIDIFWSMRACGATNFPNGVRLYWFWRLQGDPNCHTVYKFKIIFDQDLRPNYCWSQAL